MSEASREMINAAQADAASTIRELCLLKNHLPFRNRQNSGLIKQVKRDKREHRTETHKLYERIEALYQSIGKQKEQFRAVQVELSDAKDSALTLRDQLKEAKSTISQLRTERSLQVNILPVSTRTEEDFLKEVRNFNQKIADLAHQLQSSNTAKRAFGNSRKTRSVKIQVWVTGGIWRSIFQPFFPFQDFNVEPFMEFFRRLKDGMGTQSTYPGATYMHH
jgi:archaellum component FlaC